MSSPRTPPLCESAADGISEIMHRLTSRPGREWMAEELINMVGGRFTEYRRSNSHPSSQHDITPDWRRALKEQGITKQLGVTGSTPPPRLISSLSLPDTRPRLLLPPSLSYGYRRRTFLSPAQITEHNPPFRGRLEDTPACTPEMDLTPTQCVLRNVLSIDTGGAPEPGGGGGGGHIEGHTCGGHSPTPSEEQQEHFANSVLKLHENGEGGGRTEGEAQDAEGGAVRNQGEDVRLLSGGGGGFLEGLFGCLKPVWTMIGKAYSTEHKHNLEGGTEANGGENIWEAVTRLLCSVGGERRDTGGEIIREADVKGRQEMGCDKGSVEKRRGVGG
ncbi:hypothetical protein DPEC_G00209090 [Dallia pectoralis]|uniref:Uncharacterized protein n=1 Tax=Dallia pectoralis TaxID=75939 RepID=A0ACC2G5M8_DALPE|nr:hypothetical protein DPEC_G00209090 [Dallia pectoralis]